MDENEDQGVEGGEEISHENGTANRIAALEANQANNQARLALAQLTADPDVQAVIRAKQAGKSVKVTDVVEAEEVDVETPVGDDADPNTVLLSNIGKLVDAKLGKLKSEFESQLGEVQSVTNAVTQRDVSESIAAARKQYRDFDQYKDGMLEIVKKVPGLTTSDYYLLAKSRAGKLRMVEAVTESEKPTSQPARSHQQRGAAPAKRPQGRKGFSELLAEKLAGMNFEGSDTQ